MWSRTGHSLGHRDWFRCGQLCANQLMRYNGGIFIGIPVQENSLSAGLNWAEMISALPTVTTWTKTHLWVRKAYRASFGPLDPAVPEFISFCLFLRHEPNNSLLFFFTYDFQTKFSFTCKQRVSNDTLYVLIYSFLSLWQNVWHVYATIRYKRPIFCSFFLNVLLEFYLFN